MRELSTCSKSNAVRRPGMVAQMSDLSELLETAVFRGPLILEMTEFLNILLLFRGHQDAGIVGLLAGIVNNINALRARAWLPICRNGRLCLI